jgi:cytochrome c oxidase subunit 3
VTIGFVLLSLLMGTIVWWLFRQTLNVQPWLALPAGAALRGKPARPPIKTALWVFLTVATSLFGLFISAYAMRLSFVDWSPLPQPRLLQLNTALLVAASIAMEWTVFAARRADASSVRKGLWAGGALTFGFLAGQLVVWNLMADAGYFVGSSAASAFFYLLTAVHGLHVLGGLVAWARAGLRARRDGDPARLRLAVELCAIYWHFLLAVWVVVFALLVSKDLGLPICSSAVPL